jgi:hypothetical protein
MFLSERTRIMRDGSMAPARVTCIRADPVSLRRCFTHGRPAAVVAVFNKSVVKNAVIW